MIRQLLLQGIAVPVFSVHAVCMKERDGDRDVCSSGASRVICACGVSGGTQA